MISLGFIGLGLILLTICELNVRQLPRWIPILWIARALIVSHMIIHRERLDRVCSTQDGRAVLEG